MDVFTMVTVIVVFGTVSGVVSTYLKTRNQSPSGEVLERIEKLERRVNELETAVTNEERELRRRFADLEATS